MIQSSAAYQTAITGDARRIFLQAVIDIISPDIVYGTVDSSGALAYSQPQQLYDKKFQLTPYATLEPNRWALNGQFQIFPDSPDGFAGAVGFIGDVLSDETGTFSPAVFVEEQFSGVTVLQACSIYFPTDPWDGIPVDFTVEVLQGGTAYFTKEFTGNTETKIDLDGFTVNNADAIRVTVTKWSLPGRRLRAVEILPGIYETWDNSILSTFNVVQQGNFACAALPYGTCTMSMDNLDRRFEPRNKDGIFKSIEERQGIQVSIGVELPDGTVDYKPLGVYYQFSGGWKTGDNGVTMTWDLVDIVGLLADREFMPPSSLPTTLDGWVAALVSQLGVNFANAYIVDPDYASLPLTATLANVTGKSCGDLLRYACMATGTWPRADSTTGKLAVEPFWSQGNLLDLDNMNTYPVMKANDDIAAIIFTLADGNNTQYVVPGTSTASSDTVSVNSPFISTQAQALTAARQILSAYGGNKLEATGRGNPASEIGDVPTVQLNESLATTGRLMMQTFSFSDGVMVNCQSTLLQADGSYQFEERAVITESGSWTAPANVKGNQLRIIVSQGGTGSTDGTAGTFEAAGTPGTTGPGGKVFAATININPQQVFPVNIGAGGGKGQEGGETTFGSYSSANGKRFEYGYTDVASGSSYARPGVQLPLPNSGDGGMAGAAGIKGNKHLETIYYTDEDGNEHSETVEVIDNYPTAGTPGVAGATGCVVVYWDKEAET